MKPWTLNALAATMGLPLLLVAAPPAGAGELPSGRSLAVDMGCVNCHGAPRGEAPAFDRLAAHFAGRSAAPDELARLAVELRRPHAAHRIVVHENLSQETANRLMQWLADGAK